MSSSEVLVTVLAGFIGFIVILVRDGADHRQVFNGPRDAAATTVAGRMGRCARRCARCLARRYQARYMQKIEEFDDPSSRRSGTRNAQAREERLQQINLAFDAAERRFTGR